MKKKGDLIKLFLIIDIEGPDTRQPSDSSSNQPHPDSLQLLIFS